MTVTLKLEQNFLPVKYTESLIGDKQPMNVIFINCERDVEKVRNLSKDLSLYGNINLVLFVKGFESSLITTCTNPVGNPFLLSESASFFVKCYEDIVIREWYAFDKNKLEIYERVTWEPERRLILKSRKLMQSDNDSVNGKLLRIGRFLISEKYDKYFDELFLALNLAGNFTTKINEVKGNVRSGSWNASSQTWSGGMGLIQNREIDILGYVMPPYPRILDSADLTVALQNIDLCIYIRKPTSKVGILWAGYLKPFTYQTWCAMIGVFIVTVTLLTFLRLKVENGLYHGAISENFLHVWGCYFQQGLPEFPEALPLRIFYYSTIIFGFFMFAIYSASFVSELTVLQDNLPFKSLEEFVKDKSYKLATNAPLFYDERVIDPMLTAIQKKLIKRDKAPKNTQAALYLICSQKVALFSVDFITTRLSADIKIPCRLVKINLERTTYFRMAMPKKSPYIKAINYYIIRLRSNGVLKRIELKLRDSIDKHISTINEPTEQKFQPGTILDVASLLAVFFGSLLLSILIIFFEKMYLAVHQSQSLQISTRFCRKAARVRKLNWNIK
ncbi:probable glutamate receptor [Belonocnema kinseyi]|uniref:probable glutamate receptor n=1 Tax=Belonocnema kinseyi TaxID=2817044 RepID=UPI00143DFAAA|nr:probable glutamate receptor [Belonocnema kinseyi]